MLPTSANQSIAQPNTEGLEQEAVNQLCYLIDSVNEGLSLAATDISMPTDATSTTTGTFSEAYISSMLASIIGFLKPFCVKKNTINLSPARNIPLSETTIVSAHNAFNISGTGLTSIMPNQSLSLSQLLDAGVRALALDTYVNKDKDLVLCHGICNQTFSFFNTSWLFGNNTRLSEALGAISKFITQHPTEVVIVKLEDYVKSDRDIANLAATIKTTFNPESIFTPDDLSKLSGKWPSIDGLVAMGKQVVFMPQHLSQNKIDSLCDGLLFHTGFRNPSGLKFYCPAYEVAKDGFNFSKASGQFVEVGEDGTLAGWLMTQARKIPGIDKMIMLGTSFLKGVGRAFNTMVRVEGGRMLGSIAKQAILGNNNNIIGMVLSAYIGDKIFSGLESSLASVTSGLGSAIVHPVKTASKIKIANTASKIESTVAHPVETAHKIASTASSIWHKIICRQPPTLPPDSNSPPKIGSPN